MVNWISAFLLALVGGAAGALAVGLVRGASGTPQAAPPAERGTASGDVAARLQRIEDALARLDERSERRLQGRAPTAGAGLATGDGTQPSAAEAALLDRIEARVADTMEAKWKELGEKQPPKPPEKEKKRLPLADVAAEMDLTASEEASLRQIYAESQDKMYEILTNEGEDPQAIRREIESAKDDPKQRQQLILKYMPRVIPKLGDFMSLEAQKQQRIQTLLGPERAARLDDYDIIEENPLGIGGNTVVRTEVR
jgi:hypothetical protein